MGFFATFSAWLNGLLLTYIATNTAGKPIKIGAGSGGIAITPDGKTAYVAGKGSVIPIATATNTAGKPTKVGQVPFDGMAITPDGKSLYVVNLDSGTVIPITIATDTAGKPISVGATGPVAITPDGKSAYVADANGRVTPIMIATKVGFSSPRNASRFASANPTCLWRMSVIMCST